MGVNDITNLYVGYNAIEEFCVLINAPDINKANEIAEGYRVDSDMQDFFIVKRYQNENIRFDCDYVLE